MPSGETRRLSSGSKGRVRRFNSCRHYLLSTLKRCESAEAGITKQWSAIAATGDRSPVRRHPGFDIEIATQAQPDGIRSNYQKPLVNIG